MSNTVPCRAAPGCSVVVMARAPRPGCVNTRLEPVLGPFGCADLQTALTRNAVTVARAAAPTSTYLAVDDPAALPPHALSVDVPLLAQRGDDLGARMAGAVTDVFAATGEPVIIIGTDVPTLTPEKLRAAMGQLCDPEGPDVVLGPALDGGYYLVGVRRRHREVFAIDPRLWGGRDVLSATTAAAARAGLHVGLLTPLRDLDTPDDLAALATDDLPADIADVVRRAGTRELNSADSVSIVVPTRDEEETIGPALRRLRTHFPGCELVVVDGGSTDATVGIASGLATVVNSAPGRGPQLNAGAAHSHGQVLWFVHVDSVVEPGALTAMHAALTDPRVIGGGLRLRFDPPDPLALRWLAWWSNQRAGRLGQVFGDQAMFLRRETFDAVGGFPPIPIMEDLQICRRLRRVGRLAVVDATATSSARRLLHHGPWRMVAFMQYLKALHALGVPAERIRSRYEQGPPRMPALPRPGLHARRTPVEGDG